MRSGLRRLKSVRAGAPACLLVLTATIAACGIITNNTDQRTPDVFDKVRSVDLLPRFPEASDQNASRVPGGTRPSSYYGSVTAAVEGAPPGATGEGFELNFENTPVTTVAKVILGDIMGVGYTIDPRVQGTVTLASGRPVPKSDVLYVLESALRVSNVVMVRESRGYRLTPAPEAVGTGTVDTTRNPEAGFGITVVPLQYVSAPTLMKLLDSFAMKPGTVRADTGRNMIVIQGNGAERRSAIDTVLAFDQDWMRGQSVGIYPVRNSTPEPIITELEKIMDAGEGGLSQNVVKLQPIGRQNAILVVTRKPELLRTAAMWITRLDTSDAAATGVRVYRVRYGEARQLAGLLNDMFVGRSAGGLESPTNQIAPGAGVTTLSAGGPSGGGMSGGGFAATGAGGQLSGSFTMRQQPTPQQGAPAGEARATQPTATGIPALDSSTAFSRSPSFGAGGPAAILPGVRITADVVNNALLIYANQENYRIIERTLQQLDRPQLQVAIDAIIAEVTLNESLTYGVQFFLKSKDVGLGPDKGSVGVFNTAAAVLARSLPGFNFLIGSEATPRLLIDALQEVTDVKLLSTPSVVVIDHQVATLQVGDQIPVATQSAVSVIAPGAPVVNNIDYRNTGIILRVLPRINVNGNVLLDIEQEISNVGAGAATLTPTVAQRRVKSSISVASGQTVLLGGLISDRQERGRAGLPLLDRLGPLGEALGKNSGAVQRTELIIFIRPQIIRDSVDAHRVAEELRTRLGGRFGTYAPPPTPIETPLGPPSPARRVQPGTPEIVR